MRYVFFDLGDTLETSGRPRPNAREALQQIQALRDDQHESPRLGLISDFTQPGSPADIPAIEAEYLDILRALGIDRHFEPFEQAVTLSSQVGVFKPDRRVFRAALDKFDPDAHFHDAIFITEDAEHVRAARELGMLALHLAAPGESAGDVASLAELPQHVARLLRFSPCGKRPERAVGRFTSAAAKSKRTDPALASLVATVDTDRLRSVVESLSAFPTRWSHASAITSVTTHLHDRFVSLGYAASREVRFQPFSLVGAAAQRNVLCGPERLSRPTVLVCAHYDSTSEKAAVLAPGADDNASGIAALLELAAVLRGVPLKHDLLFAAFGGEEQGLFGSAACADIAKAEGWPIELVINMDMIGFPNGTPDRRIVVEFDQGNRNPANDAAAKAFGLVMAQAAADYTALAVEHTDIWNSDYMPFEAHGFACIGAYEGGTNPFYHRSTDEPSTVDIDYLADVVRMVMATIVTIGT